jgi:hypothetical protein
MAISSEDLKFPIGRYTSPETITATLLKDWLDDLASLPHRLKNVLNGLSDEQLDMPYRPGGWTVRQLVHHLADSHLNAHCRIRLALTENSPTIKPYEQDEWAKLPDVLTMPVNHSLEILSGLHARWVFLIKNLNGQELNKSFVHPEHGKTFSVADMVGMYVHHGNNHLAQIEALKKRMDW